MKHVESNIRKGKVNCFFFWPKFQSEFLKNHLLESWFQYKVNKWSMLKAIIKKAKSTVFFWPEFQSEFLKNSAVIYFCLTWSFSLKFLENFTVIYFISDKNFRSEFLKNSTVIAYFFSPESFGFFPTEILMTFCLLGSFLCYVWKCRWPWNFFKICQYSFVPNRRVYSFIWHQRNMKKETDTKTDKSI